MTYVKFSNSQKLRMKKLLHMEYTRRELAQECACSFNRIQQAIDAGCPHRHSGGRVYVVGDTFADWVANQLEPGTQSLGEGEAWCFRCNAPRRMVNIRVADNPQPGVVRLEGECSECGMTVNRYTSQEANS